jgi:hypothetical protein
MNGVLLRDDSGDLVSHGSVPDEDVQAGGRVRRGMGGAMSLVARVALAATLGLLTVGVPIAAAVEPPVLLGFYADQNFLDASGPGEAHAINDWLGDPSKALSIGGLFLDFEYPDLAGSGMRDQLEGVWQAGLVPLVNLAAGYAPGRTMADIAQGAIDPAIIAWAETYRDWATGGRRAFIAPLEEMNGAWTSYGLDPDNFKLAWARIQTIFRDHGVPADSVRWVFAPNGWSQPGHEFERYYPGHASVDVVGFSAFNYSTCGYTGWDTFDEGIRPYLDRMRAMAPAKPIFLVETGTVADGGDKNAWLDDTYTQLAAYPALRAVLYFARRGPEGLCALADWRFYAKDNFEFPGFRNAVLRPQAGFGHWGVSDPDWTSIAFVDVAPSPFDDVPTMHPFTGLDTAYYHDFVGTLVAAGVTGGCSVTPPLYCPDAPVTREQMAVFLLKAREGAAFVPALCLTPAFADVPCASSFAAWIQELVARGITAGCGGVLYCPGSPVTREQMAVFLLKTLGVTPAPCTVAPFDDVPCTSPFASWITELVNRGITAGCSATTYCPTAPVTRGQMAVFLVKAFALAP